jgi:Dolichyl-phosphate-mannose-protein mannosyltransferase
MTQARRLIQALAGPFTFEGKSDVSLILVFLLVNLLVFVNAWLHDPRIGYDGFSHLDYIRAFSKLHSVTAQESDEFFSPPLPYLFPSVLIATTGMNVLKAAKFAQFLNALLSIGLIYYLIKICRLISPKKIVAFGAVVFLGILPVYYKSFAFVRGEPYVAFFAIVGTYYFLKIFVQNQFSWSNIIAAGLATGGCILSRQWGVLLVPAIFVFGAVQWFRHKQSRFFIFKTVAVSLTIAFLVSSWFYLGLKRKYGSFSAFNRAPNAAFSFGNQPPSFYFGVAPGSLFSNPVRPNFANQFLPIFYSEIWGDYWGFFLVFGRDLRQQGDLRMTGPGFSQFEIWTEVPSWMVTNYQTMGAYLGRVNRVSIFPSLLALIATGAAMREAFRRKTPLPAELALTERRKSLSLLLLTVAFAFAGYLWFLILFPSLGKGDTIKATYMLHIFPVIAIFVGLLLERVEQQSRLISRLVIGALLVVALHNLPAMITHYPLSSVR